jgi:DNA-binding MarR family transcriptional regulator
MTIETLIETCERICRRRTTAARTLILAHVFKNKSATMGQIAKLLDVSTAAVTNPITDFVNEGLMERVPDGDDRRKIWMVLTKAGERKVKEMIEQTTEL